MATATTTRNGTQIAYTLNSRGMPVPQTDVRSSGPSSTHSSQPLQPSPGIQKMTEQPSVDGEPSMASAEVPNVDIEAVIPPREPLVGAPSQHQKNESVVSYALPLDPTRRVVERYHLDDNAEPVLSQSFGDMSASTKQRHMSDLTYSLDTRPMSISTLLPTKPRHPALPDNNGTAVSSSSMANGGYFPRIQPAFASPQRQPSSFAPVSTSSRAMAQQPTYINPPHTPVQVNPEYAQPRIIEDVCLECAMRDEDMAGVDVTSPGAWERESDADFYELLRLEREEQDSSGVSMASRDRPKSSGDRLLESSVRIWIKMNPTEPDSRHQTLIKYVRSQRSLLEEEALAHARAVRESQQLEARAKDAFTRRSINGSGISGSPRFDEQAMRHTSSGSGGRSRDVVLLENGLLVESLDMKKEEKEERERKRKEEKARKSSRTSVYSVATDSGVGGLKPTSRLSAGSSGQGNSFARERDWPPLPRAQSQASFSDIQSTGSPKRRFFGFKNLNTGLRSRDSLAGSVMSGSMMDMHLGLQRDSLFGQSPDELSPHVLTLRVNSRVSEEGEQSRPENTGLETTKKRGGLAKIWRLVTGAKASEPRYPRGEAFSRTEDNLPLTPPPPLSYLVERNPANAHRRVISSTSSLPSMMNSPKFSIMANGGHHGFVSPLMSSTPLSTSPGSPAPRSRNASGSRESRDIATELRNPSDPHQRSSMIEAHPRSVSMPTLRPMSIYASHRDKSLPALPPDAAPAAKDELKLFPTAPNNGLPPGAGPPMPGPYLSLHDLSPANTANTVNLRSQTFNGITAGEYMPQKVTSRSFDPSTSRSEALECNDFAVNPRPLDLYAAPISETNDEPTSGKRKSRFNLPSLFSGRKSTGGEPFARSIRSETIRDDSSSVGYNSRSSVGPRLSIMSRRYLEESIEQDPQFVAYRYPSNQACDPVQ